MEQAKKDFLKTVIFDQTEYEKLIDRIYAETKDSETNDAYIFLISQNAHKTQEDIKDFQVEDFLKEVYKNWYGFFQKYTLTTNNNELTDFIQTDLKNFEQSQDFCPKTLRKMMDTATFSFTNLKTNLKQNIGMLSKTRAFSHILILLWMAFCTYTAQSMMTLTEMFDFISNLNQKTFCQLPPWWLIIAMKTNCQCI